MKTFARGCCKSIASSRNGEARMGGVRLPPRNRELVVLRLHAFRKGGIEFVLSRAERHERHACELKIGDDLEVAQLEGGSRPQAESHKVAARRIGTQHRHEMIEVDMNLVLQP